MAEPKSRKTGEHNGRPGGLGPPPLPRITGSMAAAKPGGRRSFVDISDIAELVESLPPPAPRSKK